VKFVRVETRPTQNGLWCNVVVIVIDGIEYELLRVYYIIGGNDEHT
jgi:uncharacterized membrane protein YwaF